MCRLHQRDRAFGDGPSAPALESSPAASTSAPDSALPTGAEPVNLDPADFTADITHPYWPMKPGTRWTYRDVDEKGEIQTVVVVVTTETKKLANGITARVVRDTVRSDGELVEDTLDWYAQDSAGNVWYMGEDTAEFENGKIASRVRFLRGRRWGRTARHPAARRAAGRPKVSSGIPEG